MTIKDLAEKSGYSVATVSRVLNNHPNVSDKAREEINKLVDKCGFQINTNAQQLKQHANSIVVVVKGTSNEMFAEMIETIQTQIDKTDYPLHVDYMDEDCNEVLRAIQLCREKNHWVFFFSAATVKIFREISEKSKSPVFLYPMTHRDCPLITYPAYPPTTVRLRAVQWIP